MYILCVGRMHMYMFFLCCSHAYIYFMCGMCACVYVLRVGVVHIHFVWRVYVLL